MQYTYLEDPAAGIDIPADATLSKTVFKDERLKVVLFAFDRDQQLSEHTAASPAVIQVLSGRLDLTLGGDEITAEPGSWVHMPAGLPHAVRAAEPSVMLLTLVRTSE